MITDDKKGVICDLCGEISANKFKYFSAKIDLVEVDGSIGKSGIVDIDRRFLDMDICEKCMEVLKQRMLKVIEKQKK
jgi:hypothetical protein